MLTEKQNKKTQTKETKFILLLNKLMVKFLSIRPPDIITSTEMDACHLNTEVTCSP